MTNTTREEKLLKEAHERFDNAQSAWNTYYKECRNILEFIHGDQWDQQLRNNRVNAGLPCLQASQMDTFLRQITNESRQNCPSIQVDPKSDGADQMVAEIYSDLIRGIEQESDASTAYDNASWYAAAIGLGFFRIISEFEESTFLQKMLIKPINDPLSVLMDPNHKELSGSDAEYCFILSELTRDEYLRTFPNTKLASSLKDDEGYWSRIKSWAGQGRTNQNHWVKEDTVLIAEYYWKDYEEKTLYQVWNSDSGDTYVTEEKPDEVLLKTGTLKIINSRIEQVCTIRWAKLNDVEVLDETTWPGDCIPVIAVKGAETWIESERKLKGAVKDAIDSQRVYNYNYSVMAETVTMTTKTPWIVEIRQVQNHERYWRDANNSTLAYLPYDDVPGVAPPIRNNVEPAVQAAIAAMHEASESMKSVFGMFGATIGQNQPGQEAFRTVLARQQAAHTTTYHFYDNLAKAVQTGGNILVKCIPVFYSDERSVQLIKQNGSSSTSAVNGNGQPDLRKGNFGVVVETGPSFATRRQDSVAHMLTFQEANPNVQLGDIIADESDWPGAKRIAARIRLSLPPEIQQAEAALNNSDPKAAAAQAITQVKALSTQLQQAQQNLQEMQLHQKASDDLIKKQHMEIMIQKAEAKLDLEKQDKETALKREEMSLNELETELSYRVKMKELELQERQMRIEEAKLGIEGVKVMSDINSDMHDHAIKHEEVMAVKVPSLDKDNTGASGPEGLDKSFQTMTGTDVGNA